MTYRVIRHFGTGTRRGVDEGPRTVPRNRRRLGTGRWVVTLSRLSSSPVPRPHPSPSVNPGFLSLSSSHVGPSIGPRYPRLGGCRRGNSGVISGWFMFEFLL